MSKYSCGTTALYRSPKGDLVFGKWSCGATLKCHACAQRRAARLLFALKSVQAPELKLIALTVTFKPSLGVTHKNLSKFRHAIFEHLRRSLKLSGRELEYVSVVERHKSGLPHLHIAIWYPTVRMLMRDARVAVKGSHVRAKLIRDDRQLRYLAKYVGKQSGAKLTSSRNVARLSEKRTEEIWELVSIKPNNLTEKEWLNMIGMSTVE